MLGQTKMLVAHCLHANKFVSYIEWGEYTIYILLGDPERRWRAPILHCPVWARGSCHALQVQSLPNVVHRWRCQQTVKNEYRWHQIYHMLTLLFCSALCSIRYVEDQWTFMSMISWTGLAIPPLDWMVFHIAFRFDEDRSLITISFNAPIAIACCLIHTLTAIALTNPTLSRLVGTCTSGFFGSKCGDLLYVDMRAWVAKFMMCARQLQNIVSWNRAPATSRDTHLIFRFRQA